MSAVPTIRAPVSGDLDLPEGREFNVLAGRRSLRLTNVDKEFFPGEGIRKGDLLEYYAAISDVLLPHLQDRAMVMKRYPNGIAEEHFFMKRTPAGAPDWIRCCSIEHRSSNVIDFPMIQDLAALLWVVNLGCIDLNPWYSRCDDVNRPDFLNFDLDPVAPATFAEVRRSALVVRDRLLELGIPSYAKTSGSRGIHIYVPIERNLRQKQVWTFAKRLAFELATEFPELITAEYRIKNRPPGRVLMDYNQNSWGSTLASVYSVRPRPGAPVSTPVRWEEIEAGVEIGDFTIGTVVPRIREIGDLWRKLLWKRGRFDLSTVL